jgi:hypothetical protein
VRDGLFFSPVVGTSRLSEKDKEEEENKILGRAGGMKHRKGRRLLGFVGHEEPGLVVGR